jgi:hypothetical protein
MVEFGEKLLNCRSGMPLFFSGQLLSKAALLSFLAGAKRLSRKTFLIAQRLDP